MLLFHALRVNSLLGHLRRSSFRNPHDISCLSLNHYFVSLFSKFLLFRTEWCFFPLTKFMLAHPYILNSSRAFTASPGDLCCDFSWQCEEGLGVLGEPLVPFERIDMDLAFFQSLHCRNCNLSYIIFVSSSATSFSVPSTFLDGCHGNLNDLL